MTDFEAWASRVSGKPVRMVTPERRREAWKTIQRDAPELAELMLDLREEFGRVDLEAVRIAGKRVWPP